MAGRDEVTSVTTASLTTDISGIPAAMVVVATTG